jgi:hypothetical protein
MPYIIQNKKVDNYVRKRCKTGGLIIWKPIVVIRTLNL